MNTDRDTVMLLDLDSVHLDSTFGFYSIHREPHRPRNAYRVGMECIGEDKDDATNEPDAKWRKISTSISISDLERCGRMGHGAARTARLVRDLYRWNGE